MADRAWTATATLFLGAGAASFGQALSPTGNPAIDPQKIVRDASWNELHATKPGRSFSYRATDKVDPKGSTVKQIVETKDGDVARLIEKNGKPLPPDEAQAELTRLNNLLAHPEIQEHRHKKEQEDSARGDEMVRMLPDAFLFTLDGMVEGPQRALLPAEIPPESRIHPAGPGRRGLPRHGRRALGRPGPAAAGQDRCSLDFRREFWVGRTGEAL